MVENSIISLILLLCAFLIGRRFYRQWRAALDPKSSPACCSSCSGCAVDECSEKK